MKKSAKNEIKQPEKMKLNSKDLENFKNRQISKLKNKESTIIKSSISK